MKNRFYTINEDPSTFVVLQRRGFVLCYCINCNTLFEIENVWYDHIYKCAKCNSASVIEKDNKHNAQVNHPGENKINHDTPPFFLMMQI